MKSIAVKMKQMHKQPTKLQPPDHPSFQCITLKRLLPDTAQEDNHCRVRLRAMLMTRSAFPPRISPYIGPKMGKNSRLNQTWGCSSTSCRDYIPTYEVNFDTYSHQSHTGLHPEFLCFLRSLGLGPCSLDPLLYPLPFPRTSQPLE